MCDTFLLNVDFLNTRRTRLLFWSNQWISSAAKNYVYPSSAPLKSETHGGDDVGVFALGPWSHLFTGVYEQNVIPHLMAYASCIGHGLSACWLPKPPNSSSATVSTKKSVESSVKIFHWRLHRENEFNKQKRTHGIPLCNPMTFAWFVIMPKESSIDCRLWKIHVYFASSLQNVNFRLLYK